MSQLFSAWNRHCAPLAYLGALGLLVSSGLPWLRGDASSSFTALQAAQLFLGPAAWLLFALLASALLYLLRPVHAMRLSTDLLAVLALPIWVITAGLLLLSTQHQSLAAGAVLAGLSSALLTASALTTRLSLGLNAQGPLWTHRLAVLLTRVLSLR